MSPLLSLLHSSANTGRILPASKIEEGLKARTGQVASCLCLIISCASNAIFCCKVNRSLFGDAVYEGWEPVPGTITPGSVLDVH
jgi:hypothetical protein